MDFIGTDAVLGIGDKPDSGKPFVQTDGRVFHNGSRFNRELLRVVFDATFPDSRLFQKDDLVGTATRAPHSFWPAKRRHEREAGVRIRESADGFQKGCGEVCVAHEDILAISPWSVKYIIAYGIRDRDSAPYDYRS